MNTKYSWILLILITLLLFGCQIIPGSNEKILLLTKNDNTNQPVDNGVISVELLTIENTEYYHGKIVLIIKNVTDKCIAYSYQSIKLYWQVDDQWVETQNQMSVSNNNEIKLIANDEFDSVDILRLIPDTGKDSLKENKLKISFPVLECDTSRELINNVIILQY